MRNLIALAFTVLCCCRAHADTFIVTSNADSGPGSLREMIVAANSNGSTITDYIHFNIPQPEFNLRIINLVTELPSFSSNIIIDGSTQPGANYGSTEARICIKMNLYAPSFSIIKIENASNVQVYGLMLYYGYVHGFFGTPYRSEKLYGVHLVNSANIIIGAPGKGNVITGVKHCIYSSDGLCSDVVIKTNYLGHRGFYFNSPLDIDPIILFSDCGITFGSVKNIMIGGASPAEGNIFGTKTRAVNIDSRYTTGNGFINMQHNIFGRTYDKTTLVDVYDFWDPYVRIGRSRNNPEGWTQEHTIDYKINILDNDIPNHVGISYVSDSIIIKRNKFEEDQRSNTGASFKLSIYRAPAAGIIGGTEPADANTFMFKKYDTYFNSVLVYNSGPITVYKNVFDCNTGYGSTTRIENFNLIPTAQVDETTVGMVKGRATPGTRVDLYYDDACSGCEGKKFISSLMADAAGTWTYNAPITGTVVAAATSNAGYTGNFSEPTFDNQNKVVIQPSCGKKNGSVTGITSEGAESWFWIESGSGDTASYSIDLINAGPGNYSLYGVHGGTCIKPGSYFKLEDNTPKIWQNGVYVTQPSCGLFNGSISGIVAAYSQNSKYKWINNAGVTLGTNLNINGLGAGTYRFVVTDTLPGGACSDTASFVLTNLSGPTLNVNQLKITPATCGNSTGRITGIVASAVNGSAFVQWVNVLNQPVGNSLDLLNVAPGQYRLKFKDGTACDTIVTPFYIVPDVGSIVIDSSNKKVTASKCLGNTGSIQQLKVTGAQEYIWINMATNLVVGNSLDIYNLPAGNYKLTLKNASGCQKVLPVINVPQLIFSPLNVTAFNTGSAVCNQANAFIHVTSFSHDISFYRLAWMDSITGQVKGAGTQLDNVPAGTYELLATDSNSCTKKIFSAVLQDRPMPAFDYSQVNQKNDHCNLKEAGITTIKVNNLNGPTEYTWYNGNNVVVGNNINLAGVGSGSYILKIKDAGFCNIESAIFTLTNSDNGLPQPAYDDLIIPRYSSAQLSIKNPSSGTYRLAILAGGAVVQNNTSGNFVINNITNDTSFYVTRVQGTCQSEPLKVNIKVVDKSVFAIPAAFTPNGDGVNERLNVKVVGYIQLSLFKIYNKWGELVFETSKLNTGWNGIYKGVLQNTGSYIWVAEGKDINGKVVKDKGSFTLIR